MTRHVSACIGLGGNVGDVAGALQSSLAALAAHPEIRAVQASRMYRTPAWGREDQPDFLNACAVMETSLAPLELLDLLQALEQQHGRVRLSGGHWGPRTLDLDLLLYGQEVIDHPRLQVPHPWMHQRAFVLVPLAELVPQRVIPGLGTVQALLPGTETGEVAPIGG